MTTPSAAACSRSVSSVPASCTLPALGRSAAPSAHSSDDLPAPDGPVTASSWPGWSIRSTGWTATRSPYRTSTPRTSSSSIDVALLRGLLGDQRVAAVLVEVEADQRAGQQVVAHVERERQKAVGRDHGVLLAAAPLAADPAV